MILPYPEYSPDEPDPLEQAKSPRMLEGRDDVPIWLALIPLKNDPPLGKKIPALFVP